MSIILALGKQFSAAENNVFCVQMQEMTRSSALFLSVNAYGGISSF